MALYGTLGENDIAELSASISDTAVDVFLYDTRKDSDGGDWRKRTQHTSWYNETLNTSIRGSRREFPAVAVIVTDSSYHIKIYDGDDPDMPLWMEFRDVASGSGLIPSPSAKPESIAAINGIIVFGNVAGTVNSGQAGVLKLDFIGDAAYRYMESGSSSYSGKWIGGGLANRNTGTPTSGSWDNTLGYIVDNDVNDVAMTVLPNAPIDDATGLPVPTIAVATGGGYSIIKDDGTVVDGISSQSNHNKVEKITFTDNNQVAYIGFDYNTSERGRFIRVDDLISADTTITSSIDESQNSNALYGNSSSGITGDVLKLNIPSSNYTGESFIEGKDGNIMFGNVQNLFLINENVESPSSGMHAGIATDFNTGYMHGDIKGAFLSDTDTTNVTGSELVVNGTFDSNANGWSVPSGSSSTITYDATDDNLDVVRNNETSIESDADITLEVGKTYILTWELVATSNASSGYVYFGINGMPQTPQTSEYRTVGVKTHQFTATGTGGKILIYAGGVTGLQFTLDNISLREAEEDRSVNDNGLQVFGTVTKSAVATGAELVAYSGFSNSNVLVQPYNSDLNPGTGNYSFMCWFKCSSTSAEQIIMRRFGNPTVTGGMMLRVVSSSSVLQWYVRGTDTVGYVVNTSNVVDDNVWHCVVGTREGGTAKLYLDGQLIGSQSVSTISHDPGSTAKLVIGAEEVTNSPGTFQNSASNCSLALIRYSLSVPSEEQVKKMYHDEKHLFQENAKATLYGSSDAVTALGYDEDTELLHVGTSAGRSDFQGLRRINNTTTAVSTAISASNSLIVEQ